MNLYKKSYVGDKRWYCFTMGEGRIRHTFTTLMIVFIMAIVGSVSAQIAPIEPPPIPIPYDGYSAQLVEATTLIRAGEARDTYGVDGTGLTVAVLDSGLRISHHDFTGRVLTGYNFSDSSSGDPGDVNDGTGHGTHVAGVTCAGSVHIGIAPNANVVPLKVLNDSNSGQWEWVANALQWVIDNHTAYNITVCNLSLGGGNYIEVPDDSAYGIRERIQILHDMNIVVVIAAGNSFYRDWEGNYSKQGLAFPAICPESVSVGAVYDKNIGSVNYIDGATAYSTGPDYITPFSQRLHENIHLTNRMDIFAPGAALTSSGSWSDTGSSTMHGTSQAAPAISGVVLLMQQRHLDLYGTLPRISQIEDWLRSSAVIINDGDDENDNVNNTGLNFLRVDVMQAVGAVGSVSTSRVTSWEISMVHANDVGEIITEISDGYIEPRRALLSPMNILAQFDGPVSDPVISIVGVVHGDQSTLISSVEIEGGNDVALYHEGNVSPYQMLGDMVKSVLPHQMLEVDIKRIPLHRITEVEMRRQVVSMGGRGHPSPRMTNKDMVYQSSINDTEQDALVRIYLREPLPQPDRYIVTVGVDDIEFIILYGDVNMDGRVDINDLYAIRAHFSREVNEFNAHYDVNTHGVIDIGDMLAANYYMGALAP